LGFARVGKYEVKPVNLNSLVEETAETFGRTKKDITIEKDLAEDLLATEVDEGQIEQVLLNLYINAADAMKKRAASHGMGVVERLIVQEEKPRRLEIVAFLPSDIPPSLLGENWALATHIPYRVVLYWDGARGWIAATDPALFAHGLRSLDPELKSRMVQAKDRLLDVMAAGANGA